VLVVEDSENGVISGKEAYIKVLATINDYTKNEDLSRADAVITSLGNENEKTVVLAGNLKLNDPQMVHIDDLYKL
jgi:beta-phosphoglucomutase-like phosphatase (HAD superfamily)